MSKQAPTAARFPKRRRGGAMGRSEKWLAVAFVAPAVLVVGGVYVYPAIMTLLYSVAELEVASLSIERFVGLGNFRNAVASAESRAAILRTLYFGGMLVVLTTASSFLIALLLRESFRGRAFLRVVVLLPWALPPIVSGVLWNQMFNANFGFINGLIRSFGGEGSVVWLGDPVLALHAILVAEVWRWVPFATLFILAGLQTIPEPLYEAASVDGANAWQKFRSITVPLMWPVLLPVTIFLFIWAMKAFDTIFVLTRGGPAQSTTTLNYLVYREAFDEFSFGDAAATAYVLTLLTLLVIAALALAARWVRGRIGQEGS